MTAIAVAGVGAGVLSSFLIMTGGRLENPGGAVAYPLDTAWALIATGLAWWWYRPASAYPWALIIVGFLALSLGLQGERAPALYVAGLIGESGAVLGLAYLVLTVPTGRPAGLELPGVVLIGIAIVAGRWTLLLVDNDVSPLLPYWDCDKCGSAPFAIGHNVLPAALAQDLHVYWRLVVASGILFAVCARLLLTRGHRRAVIAPPAALAVLWLAGYAGYLGAVRVHAPSVPFLMASAAGAFILPYCFLGSLVITRAHVTGALARIMADLSGAPTEAQIQASMRRAFGDPGLRLAIQLEPGDLIDVEGRPIGPGEAGPGQRWTYLSSDDASGTAIIHDVELAEEPEVLVAAAGAARIAVANARLADELERSAGELRRTQQRTVDALDAARRHLERDLHDSAQQQLLAARLALGRARERARGRTLKARLADVERQLEGVQDELRNVAHGLEPGVLRELGLVAALRQAAGPLRDRVTIASSAIRRNAYTVESAVYHCCVEALQIALEQGGLAVRVRIRLWELDDRLHFEVSGSGGGFDPEQAVVGAGMPSIFDRVGAVGGHVEVRSAPGTGVVVAGWVPVRHTEESEGVDNRWGTP